MIRWRLLTAVLFIVFGFVAVAISTSSQVADAAAGDGPWVEHRGLVPENPQRNYPTILTTPFTDETPRQTLAVDMIGPYIISGGDFRQIRLQNGTTVTQPNLAIVDSRNRSLVCLNLDVDDEVHAIAPGPRANTAIIGGRFDTVNGSDGVTRGRNKIALIDLDNCSVDRSWIVEGLNGRVTELAVTGNRLFVAGNFTNVEGTGIGHLFEVSLDNATLNRSFDPNFQGQRSRAIVAMEASPNGNRLAIVHRATSIMGQSLRGSAIFDISNPSNIRLTAHRLDRNAGFGAGRGRVYERFDRIQSGAISPNFSTIIITQGPGQAQDYVTALPTVERTTNARWQLWMRDTTFSAAATNDVVYVAGHFCFIDRGPGNGPVLAPNGGPSVCDGLEQPSGAHRTQMAALDINDGTPLDWNPGNNALVGARALTVVDRGLLMGFDGDRSNNRFVGTTAFFDFGPDAAPTDPRDNLRCSAIVNGSQVNVSWNQVGGVTDYVVRRNSSWVASPGNVDRYTDTPPPGTHTYFIRTRIGNDRRDIQCSPSVTVQSLGQTCRASRNNNGTVQVSWDAIAGENTYSIRRNGGWIGDVGGGGTVLVDDPGAGNFTYVVRSRQNGRNTITTCTPAPITVAHRVGAGGQTCTTRTLDTGDLRLEWSAIAGENEYSIRRNGRWVANVNNATAFTATTHGPGDVFEIRSRMAGTTTDTRCS